MSHVEFRFVAEKPDFFCYLTVSGGGVESGVLTVPLLYSSPLAKIQSDLLNK